MSNRPAPLAGLGGAPIASARQATSTSDEVTKVTPSLNVHQQSSAVSTSAFRDELVRAVMPDLQVLVQHLVATAVERSIAPLLEKHRELDAALKELRSAQRRPEPGPSAKHAPDLVTSAPSFHAETRPRATAAVRVATAHDVAPIVAMAVERPALDRRAQVTVAAAYQASSLEDFPAELNGSRRKKLVFWAFAIGVVALLLSVIGMSVASNMGARF
jgi:hypothetical protein